MTVLIAFSLSLMPTSDCTYTHVHSPQNARMPPGHPVVAACLRLTPFPARISPTHQYLSVWGADARQAFSQYIHPTFNIQDFLPGNIEFFCHGMGMVIHSDCTGANGSHVPCILSPVTPGRWGTSISAIAKSPNLPLWNVWVTVSKYMPRAFEAAIANLTHLPAQPPPPDRRLRLPYRPHRHVPGGSTCSWSFGTTAVVSCISMPPLRPDGAGAQQIVEGFPLEERRSSC